MDKNSNENYKDLTDKNKSHNDIDSHDDFDISDEFNFSDDDINDDDINEEKIYNFKKEYYKNILSELEYDPKLKQIMENLIIKYNYNYFIDFFNNGIEFNNKNKFIRLNECGYFNNKHQLFEFFFPTDDEQRKYDDFLKNGYRRYHSIFYKQLCEHCNKCIPLRVPVDLYKLSRSQKRVFRKNKDIKINIIEKPSITQEKVELYKKYLINKHNKIDSDYEYELKCLLEGYIDTREINYYLDEKLVAVSIIDVTDNSISSVYCYYDTDYLDRSLGVLTVIYEIAYAKQIGKKYYYLGYYIEDLSTMAYKKNYRPNELLINNEWVKFISD